MYAKFRSTFIIAMIILALLTTMSTVSASNSRPPRNNDISNMADAMKYLQDLDAYYGDRARVRFGKRTVGIPLMQQLYRSRLNEQQPNMEMVHAAEFAAGADEPF